MSVTFASLVTDALAQPLHIAADAREEAQENLFYFGLTGAELASCTAPVVEAGLAAVLAGKRQQLLALRGDSYAMQFYCWHDAQASQLRFSLVSAAAPLPFGCPLQLVELSVVVQQFLSQDYLIFEENIFEPTTAEPAEAEEFVLSVWRTVLP